MQAAGTASYCANLRRRHRAVPQSLSCYAKTGFSVGKKENSSDHKQSRRLWNYPWHDMYHRVC